MAGRRASDSTWTADHYNVLGVSHTASTNEIKTQYYKLCKRMHPDTADHNEAASPEAFQQLRTAYGILVDPTSRRQYDAIRQGRIHPPGQPFGHSGSMSAMHRDPTRAYPGDMYRAQYGPSASRGRLFLLTVCIAVCVPVYMVGTSVKTRLDRQRVLFRQQQGHASQSQSQSPRASPPPRLLDAVVAPQPTSETTKNNNT
eukprot:m.70048 g.70048  ORF g.70048 m.70048 type:complete len:200 (+) comp8622_c0_seq2:281-880(+)